MEDRVSYYRRAFEEAKRELAELIVAQEQGQRKIVLLRQSMEGYRALCAIEGVEVEPSAEAFYLNEYSTLGEELQMLLRASYPVYERPNTLMDELKRMGRDMAKYDNPQSVIQSVLKRMVSSGEVEEVEDKQGKKAYRMPPTSVRAEEEISRLGALALERLGVKPGENVSVARLMDGIKALSGDNPWGGNASLSQLAGIDRYPKPPSDSQKVPGVKKK